jgi:hypothetical protein
MSHGKQLKHIKKNNCRSLKYVHLEEILQKYINNTKKKNNSKLKP